MELVPPGKEEKQKKDKYKLLSSKLRGKNIFSAESLTNNKPAYSYPNILSDSFDIVKKNHFRCHKLSPP